MNIVKIVILAGSLAASTWYSMLLEDRIERLRVRLFEVECSVTETKDRAERAERMADELREQVRALYSVSPHR
jgi:hypothetical protein